MHINFPDILQSMAHKDPRPMRIMVTTVYTVVGKIEKSYDHVFICDFKVTAIYFILGLTCALFFGAKSEPLITLNWRSYTGPSFGAGIPSRYALILRTVIVAFPVFDMVLSFKYKISYLD